MTLEEHHELCLGVLNLCYDHVPDDLRQAILEAVTSAQELGIPVSPTHLVNRQPLFSGGHA